MEKSNVSALLEDYFITEEIMAASEYHAHAIKIIKATYGRSARNI